MSLHKQLLDQLLSDSSVMQNLIEIVYSLLFEVWNSVHRLFSIILFELNGKIFTLWKSWMNRLERLRY